MPDQINLRLRREGSSLAGLQGGDFLVEDFLVEDFPVAPAGFGSLSIP